VSTAGRKSRDVVGLCCWGSCVLPLLFVLLAAELLCCLLRVVLRLCRVRRGAVCGGERGANGERIGERVGGVSGGGIGGVFEFADFFRKSSRMS
jgi:hypothetical protein